MSWRCPPLPTGPVRVALVGSDLDVLGGLRRRLGSCPDLLVVGSFPSLDGARSGVPPIDPDVVLVDGDLVDGRGVELCGDLRRAGHRSACLVLSGVPPVEATATGADAVVLKSLMGDLLERELIRLGRLDRFGADGSGSP